MKLWIKLTFISLFSTLAAISISLYTFSAWQSERILNNAEEQARSSLNLFCTNLDSVNKNSYNDQLSKLTSRSIAQYYFATYSHMMDGSAGFSLVLDGEYLYNTCPYDPAALINMTEKTEEVLNTFEIDGRYNVVAAKHMYIINELYTVYIFMDVTAAYAQVKDIIQMSVLLMIISAAFVFITSAALVCRALVPMNNLKQTAENIAGGQYHLRTEVKSEDEVAALAKSFNHMADTVETRIDELTEQSERRQLLLGALAHELKTPMTAVIGFADSLLKMQLDEELTLHCAQQIITAGQRTERISQKLMLLLSLSDGQKIEKKEFSLEHFAEELGQTYNSNVKISAEGSMVGDRDLLFSLVQNLINNALNASVKDSVVDVTLSHNFIQVADHGRGIPTEHIARLTEPFYRVDKARSRKHGGAGLGLSICSIIAKAHGGAMTIESKVGIGTTVTVDFRSKEQQENEKES